ncbi:MAG: hypothetical protein B6D44_01205 [Ignavibacteriales bacterium UTCHB2]|nr:MAG: hypothetical protein B6D44_01205 [Ignavibacteriales bacterium UTCHB2]
MSTTVEQRTVRNTTAGLFAFIVNFLQSIVLVPVILSYWGTIKYGNWLALFAGFTLLQTLDLGHQNYIANKMNILYHRDKIELQKELSSSLIIAWSIGLIELIITLIIIFSDNLSGFLGLNAEQFELATALILLVLMWFLFGSVGGILIRLLVPVGKYHELQWISVFIKLVQFLSLFIIVLFKGSILNAAIVYSIVQAVLTFFVLIYLRKKLPEFYPWWKGGKLTIGINNFFKSLALTINSIIQQLSVNGLILFVSGLYSVMLVPVFTTTRTLSNTAGNFTSIINSAVSPDVVKYYSKGEDKKLILTLITTLFLSGFVINLSLILSLYIIEPLYKIWTNNELTFDLNLFLFLAASVSFSNFGMGFVNYFFGVNKLKQFTYINVLKVACLFITAYLLVGFNELHTVAISVAVSELLSSVILPVYLIKNEKPELFKGHYKKFFIISFIPPILIIVLAILNLISIFSFIMVTLVLLAMLISYIACWRMIDIEIKKRIVSIVKSYLKLSSRQS